jgi:hypothetical protein
MFPGPGFPDQIPPFPPGQALRYEAVLFLEITKRSYIYSRTPLILYKTKLFVNRKWLDWVTLQWRVVTTTPTIHKIPLIPLCQRGRLLSPSLEKSGEGRFSDQPAQHIRLASRHKRYLSE